MFKPLLIGIALALPAGLMLAQGPSLSRTCLHGAAESAADRTRRQQAIDYATKVNVAETSYSIGPQLLPRGYRPLEELENLPSLPAGFDVQFHNDDRSYTFSLKDTRDPCHFAIFSDQDKLLYEAIPRAETTSLLPLGSR